MIRRRIIFQDSDGRFYTTPEFNGDKATFERMGANQLPYTDQCDAYWRDIFACFEDVQTLKDFKAASKKAQGFYHSILDEAFPEGPQPVNPVRNLPALMADDIIVLGIEYHTSCTDAGMPFTQTEFLMCSGHYGPRYSGLDLARIWNENQTDPARLVHRCAYCGEWHFWQDENGHRQLAYCRYCNRIFCSACHNTPCGHIPKRCRECEAGEGQAHVRYGRSCKYVLGYGHLGNGYTVWNKAVERNGDYVYVAHIREDRTVRFYDDVPPDVREEILHTARSYDGNVSSTQEGKVCIYTPIPEMAAQDGCCCEGSCACKPPQAGEGSNP